MRHLNFRAKTLPLWHYTLMKNYVIPKSHKVLFNAEVNITRKKKQTISIARKEDHYFYQK